jgi:hypothetical protein
MDVSQLSFASYLMRSTSYVRDDSVWKEPNPWYYARGDVGNYQISDMSNLERTCLSALNNFSKESRFTHIERTLSSLRQRGLNKRIWDLAERLIPYVYSKHVATWVMVERQCYHDVSSFSLFYDGLYLCDTLQPSLHLDTKLWRIGGRGGLPTGIYSLRSYWWRDKSKPTWQLVGDYRRGSILLHSGNSVKDSKGCILLGILAKDESPRLVSSQAVTSAVWTIMRRLRPGATITSPTSAEGARFIILRSNTPKSE